MQTFKSWMLRRFSKDELRDMVNHGVAGGFSGLIYYSETTKLYRRFHEEIWEMLTEDAESFGQTACELMATFAWAKHVESHITFANLLVWYAAERIAQAVVGDE